jgi:hypothetical protein
MKRGSCNYLIALIFSSIGLLHYPKFIYVAYGGMLCQGFHVFEGLCLNTFSCDGEAKDLRKYVHSNYQRRDGSVCGM